MRRRRLFRIGTEPVERDVDEEIESHLAIRTEQLVRAGETPERARELALARFGDVERARSALYASAHERSGRLRRFDLLQGIRRDAVLTWRQAKRRPLGTALTLATLAIAIGLTTAMFAIVDHVLLRPLPYSASDRLVFFGSVDSTGDAIDVISSDTWLDLAARNRTLESSAIYRSFDTAVMTDGIATRVPLQMVTPQFFHVLRDPFLMGRGFADDDAGVTGRGVVVSESFWRTRLAGRRIGNSVVRIQGAPYAVVGVVRVGAEFPSGTQVWLPSRPRFVGGAARNNVSFGAIGRLRAGVTIGQAQADLGAVARGIQAAEPESRYTHGVDVQPLQAHDVAAVRVYLRMLMGAVAFVLLIACVNIAGVNFSRARSRMQEVAIRMALGAGRARVMTQLITEQMLITLVGGALGVAIAGLVVRFASVHGSALLPRAGGIHVDTRVILFGLVTSLVAGIVSALAPTWRAAGAAPRELIGARVVSPRGARRSGSTVVATEIALAVLLLSGGALLLRSFGSLISRELGFDPEGVVTAHVILDTPRYMDAARAVSFRSEILGRARLIPGVTAAAVSSVVPTAQAGPGFIQVDGLADGNAGAGYRVVDSAYFRTLRVPVRSGRSFAPSDRADAPRGVVINEAMAARYWPSVSPIGRRVRALSMEGYGGREPAWLTVIGVVGNIRQWGYEAAAEPEMYVDVRALPSALRGMFVTVRTTPRNEDAVKVALAGAIRNADPELAPNVATLDARLGSMLTERRIAVTLLTVFAGIALVLSAIGIYALLSFTVGERTREIGVRMALGSRASDITALIFGGLVRVVAVGAIVGLIGALWLTRLLDALLVDVEHTDPLSYAAALVVIVLAAFAAAAVPLRRAVRVDPVTALRAE